MVGTEKFYPWNSVQNTNRSTMSIAALIYNYMRSQNQNIKVRKGWTKPAEGKLMVTIDAGFAAGCGSSRVVIRDSRGTS